MCFACALCCCLSAVITLSLTQRSATSGQGAGSGNPALSQKKLHKTLDAEQPLTPHCPCDKVGYIIQLQEQIESK